jgi:hypothetical protein
MTETPRHHSDNFMIQLHVTEADGRIWHLYQIVERHERKTVIATYEAPSHHLPGVVDRSGLATCASRQPAEVDDAAAAPLGGNPVSVPHHLPGVVDR